MSYQELFQELKKNHEELTNLLQQMKSQVFEAARSLDETEINDIFQNFQRRKLQIKSEMTTGIKDEPTRSSGLADEDLGAVV